MEAVAAFVLRAPVSVAVNTPLFWWLLLARILATLYMYTKTPPLSHCEEFLMSVVHYFGSRQQGGTLDSTARFYHESPLHEERGSVTQFGTDVPRLRDGWEWRLSSGALSLYHAASLSILDSVKVAAFTESGRRSRISGAAYKMASRALLQQLHRAAADWYARDYFADGVLPSPPMSGFLNLADMLPALPAGQHWRVKYGPSFQLSRMQGEEVLVAVALKNARAAATSAAYVTEADVEQLVRAAI